MGAAHIFSLRGSSRWVSTFVLLFLAGLLALEATSVRGKSATYDAPEHLRYGLGILHGDATRFDDSKMPISGWNALPKRIAEALGPEGSGPLRDFLAVDGTARYPTMLASLLLAWLVFRWSRQLYGRAAGLLSLVLYGLDPNLLAHARFVTTDLYAALTILLSLYAFWRFLEAPDRRSRRWRGAGAALAFGLAQVAKYTGAYLVPVLLLVTTVRFAGPMATALRRRVFRHLVPELARRLGAFAFWSLAFAAAAVLVINLAFVFQDPFWPLADFHFRSQPFREVRDRVVAVWPDASLPLPYPYLEGLDWVLARERSGQGFGNTYLLGEVREGRGFPGYFLVAGLFKVPLPTQIVWLATLVAYPLLQVRRHRFRFARDEAFLLVPVAFFTVYFNFFFQADIGIRYVLVTFPLLHVFAGCLLSPKSWGELDPRARRRLAVTGGLLAAWLAVSVLSYYPNFLPYMNELVPDRKLAYEVLADSNLEWGQDRDFIDAYRRSHPEVIWQPAAPVAGRILVGVNWLTGVWKGSHDRWLFGRFEPVESLRGSHLLFEVTPEQAEEARRDLARVQH